MKRILVFKDLAYAAKNGGGVIANVNELNLLATGAMAIVADGALVNLAAPNFADVKEFFIAVGDQTNAAKLHKSAVIRRAHANVEVCAYAAGVKEVQYIGNDLAVGALNLPATLVAGTYAAINIMAWRNTSIWEERPPYRFIYKLGAGATNAIVLAGLKALVDAKIAQNDADFPIETCAIVAGNVGLQFTAKMGYKFQLGVDEILADATIEKDGTGNSVKMVFPKGTPEAILLLEQEYSDMFGNQNKLYQQDKFYSVAQMTNPAVNYDTWLITWDMEKSGTQEAFRGNRQTLIVAIPDGAGTFSVANWNTTLAAAFDMTDPEESGS